MTTNREVFDEIADSWYRLRHWSRFATELNAVACRWQEGRLLNVGCAHGPDFLPFKHGFELWGVDFSMQMVKLARRYASKFNFEVNLTVADALSLPYQGCTFDWAIAVATYHHIRGTRQQQRAFQELRRVLKPEAEALITVWNRWQPGFWFKGREFPVAWKLKDKTLYRYYYLFTYHELGKLLTEAGFDILRMFPETRYSFPIKYFSRNICVLVKAA
jgi:SAM-dependent methyltransferase